MYCSKCKATVIECDGELLKPCECDEPIVAEMTAVVIQNSSLE